MPFFKATIGVSLNKNDPKTPATEMYLLAHDKSAAEKAFEEKDVIIIFDSDEVLKIEEVEEEEVNQLCHQNRVKIAKKLIDSGRKNVFYIDSKKIL